MKVTIELSRVAAIKLLRDLELMLRPDEEPLKVAVSKNAALLELPAWEFPWPANEPLRGRVYTVMQNRGCTVEGLCRTTERDLSYWRNLGAKGVEYIKHALSEKGLKLAMTDEQLRAYRED